MASSKKSASAKKGAKQKKPKSRKPTTGRRSTSADKNRYVQGIVTILVACYCYYAFTTAVPNIVDKVVGKIILMYLFGNAVPFLCIVAIIAGILILVDKFQFYKESIIYAILVVLNIMVILSATIPNLSTQYKIMDLFTLAAYGGYGGIIGTLIAFFLNSVITQTGTIVVAVVLTIVEILLAMRANFRDLFDKMDESNFGLDVIRDKVTDVQDSVRQKQRQKERDQELRRQLAEDNELDLNEEDFSSYRVDDSIGDDTEDLTELLPEEYRDKPVHKPKESGLLQRSEDGVIRVETSFIHPDEVRKALDEEDSSREEISPVTDEDERVTQLTGKRYGFDPSLEDEAGQNQEQKSLRQKAGEAIEKALTPYVYPSVELLTRGAAKSGTTKEEVKDHAARIRETFRDFGVDATIRGYEAGPSITRFEVKPAPGVKVSKITSLENDLALNLASSDIRIEAPIPGKDAVGIEVPNKKASIVRIRDIIDSEEFRDTEAAIPFALGKTLSGKNIVGDISTMPHLLIAGATGSGKSVCVNAMIISMIYKESPEDLKLILVDPKMVELSQYNALPHLLIPVVTDPKKAAGALNWAINEMTDRYALFSEHAVRDLDTYNKLMEKTGGEKLPRIVIIIDELADLMMTSPKEVETAICRLAQLARACGIHLVIATQRPSVDVITGLIKSNIPSRIAFSVASNVDSRTIIDTAGAEKLLGKGDMLYKPVELSKPLRVQCCYVSDAEISRVIEAVGKNQTPSFDEDISRSIELAAVEAEDTGKKKKEKKRDALFPDAVDVAFSNGQISTSMLQRRLGIGYARAGKIIDSMEAAGIISGPNGSKPRKLLMTRDEYDRSLSA